MVLMMILHSLVVAAVGLGPVCEIRGGSGKRESEENERERARERECTRRGDVWLFVACLSASAVVLFSI